MDRMIHDLLDFARIQAGRLIMNKQEQSINAVLDEAVEVHQPLARGKKIRLEKEAPFRDYHVDCDRERVAQVFSNLIGNAIKFTPDGGSIVIGASIYGG